MSYVPSSTITLYDVVNSENLSTEQKDKLKQIDLASGIDTNNYRVFSKDFLVDVFKQSLDLRQMKVQIPEKAFVASSSSTWTKENLEASLRTQLQSSCEACEVEVSIIQFNKLNNVIAWNFEINKDVRNQRVYYPVSAETLVGNDISTRTTQVVADIFFRKEVPVLNRNLNRNEIITADDVVMRKILLPSHGRFYTDVESVLGQKTKKVLKRGQLVLFNDIEKAILVKRGDQIRLRFVNNNIEISSQGVAAEAGSLGDSIKIKMPDTNKIIQAKVVSSSEVEVR